MAALVYINEKHEYQHNATKKSKIEYMYVTRGNSKFAILFEHTSYMEGVPLSTTQGRVQLGLHAPQINPKA